MKYLNLKDSTKYKSAVYEAVKVLKNGGVICYPGKNAYLLGVDILNSKAVEKVFKIKKRPLYKPLVAAVTNLIMAKKYAYI